MKSVGQKVRELFETSPKGRELDRMRRRMSTFEAELVKPIELWTPTDCIDFLVFVSTSTEKQETVRGKKAVLVEILQGSYKN